nr:endonuclease/exonuclease/phosphatase family protein [uncultured Actinoplanes sp.]
MTITTRPYGVRVARRTLLLLLTAPGLIWAAIRLFGLEGGALVPAMAFTPYVAAWSLLPLAIAVRARRWPVAGPAALATAALATGVLAACVLPRALPGRQPSAGVPLTVMTVNMFVGGADPASVVRLVREHDVAILAVQEFSPHATAGLSAAGLDRLLPYHALADEPGTTGSGIYSRFPMTAQRSERGGGGNLQEGNLQTYATIQPPAATTLDVVSAHPLAPYALGAIADWRRDLDALPRAGSGSPRIVLGDFNATLDHKPVRELIASGYRDAADATGKGLAGTWGRWPVPPVTLDHILVDERISVRRVTVHAVIGSDHRALVASLNVPAA